jgi:hypothetical protein
VPVGAGAFDIPLDANDNTSAKLMVIADLTAAEEAVDVRPRCAGRAEGRRPAVGDPGVGTGEAEGDGVSLQHVDSGDHWPCSADAGLAIWAEAELAVMARAVAQIAASFCINKSPPSACGNNLAAPAVANDRPLADGRQGLDFKFYESRRRVWELRRRHQNR